MGNFDWTFWRVTLDFCFWVQTQCIVIHGEYTRSVPNRWRVPLPTSSTITTQVVLCKDISYWIWSFVLLWNLNMKYIIAIYTVLLCLLVKCIWKIISWKTIVILWFWLYSVFDCGFYLIKIYIIWLLGTINKILEEDDVINTHSALIKMFIFF